MIFTENEKNGNTTTNDLHASKMKYLNEKNRININPLKNIPKPLVRLYGFCGIYQNVYFPSEEELLEYINNNNTIYGDACILDYLGEVAGFDNVIRKTYDDGYFVLYCQLDEEKYAIYDYEKSVYYNKFIWNYVKGNLNEEYNSLMKYSDNLTKTLMKKGNK